MKDVLKLHEQRLFAGLDPAEMEQISHIVTTARFSTGAFLFRPGDPGGRLYLLHQGRVKTFVLSEHGYEKILHVFAPGDAFGDLLLGQAHSDPSWAQALDDVVVSLMDEPAFKRFMQFCPNSCMNFFRYMCAHHSADMRRMELLLHTRASQRLVLTLLDLGDRMGYAAAEQFVIDPCFTQEELANMIGVLRSTVSTLIGQLRRNGVIRAQGRRLVVDRQAARQFLLEDRQPGRRKAGSGS